MTVILRDLTAQDLPWLVATHARLYAAEAGFDDTFGVLVAEVLERYRRDRDAACERAFIAIEEGRRLGSIFCCRRDAETAQLRLFLLVPEARGRGLGQRLLDACTGFAREAGYTRMVLWTHESHRAACALYARNGWTCTGSRPVRSFGQDLVEQGWERAL